MPVARPSALPEVTAAEAASAAYDWWAPALISLSPLGLDRTPTFGRVAEQAHEATLDAVRHWRALTELQIKAADEAFRLATAHAERRRETLTHFMETLWPTPAGAQPQEEPPHV
ncbi:MAG: hypothetical protein ACXU82_10995 [Caulobacteraceae bacterium]